MRSFIVLMGIVFLTGCLVRTYTIERQRIDTEVRGNRGYLGGRPKAQMRKDRLGPKRKITVVEMELGSHQPRKEKKAGIRAARSGVFENEQSYSESERVEVRELEVTQAANVEYFDSSEVGEQGFRYYTVQENDTLQKISSKFYGTTKKWNSIYEENKEILKTADKIYPGLRLKIPSLD